MKIYSIPTTWEVYGNLDVAADSLEEAVRYVQEHIDEVPLPIDKDYVDGSHRISVDDDIIDANVIAKELESAYKTDSLSTVYREDLHDADVIVKRGALDA